MQPNLSIGDFSRMTFVSVGALRHYHEVGLLVPVWVDPDSGYRRYSIEQVPVAQVIRRLRDLGMPLEEIDAVIRAPDVERRNHVIGTHLRRMEDQLSETRETVASLRSLLEGGAAAIPVEYRTLPSASVIAVGTDVSGADMAAWLEEAFASLRSTVGSSGLERSGPDGALFSSALLEEEFGSLVAFVPVAGAAGEGARLLPETEYAIAIHLGAFEDLDRTFGALGAAVAERAIGVQGPIRENYLVGAFDTPETDRHRTEVCWPVFQTVR
jgi:DNA-binding transcriptional MerR regulator